jgi:hypothetical protein
MPKRLRTPAVLAAVLWALGAGAQAQDLRLPKVDLDYDKDVDFAAFRTFSWKDPAAAAASPQTHVRIVWYVERELEKKGLRKAADGKGDLFVRYYAVGKQSLQGAASQGQSALPGGTGQLSTNIDLRQVLAGTLILELQRAADEKPVCRAGS